jgi:hypothetical protein
VVAPTAAEILAASQFDFPTAGYADEAALEPLVAAGGSLLTTITGLEWADITPAQEPLVLLAVRGMTEQLAMQSTPEYLETLADFDLIQSFSAGPYSETRRSAEDAMKARKLNAWPWLSDLLWQLLTPDKRDEWLAYFEGENAPAFAVTEMEWDSYYPYDGYVWGA